MNGLLIVVGVIVLIGAVNGFAKGAIKILVSLLATILTIGVVFVASPMVSEAFRMMTPMDERIETYLHDKIYAVIPSENQNEDSGKEIPRNTQIAIIENAEIPDVFKELLLSNNNSEVYEMLGVTTFVDYVVKYMAKEIIDIIAFLVTFVIVSLVMRIVIVALDFVADLPVLGILNRLSGVAVGVALSMIVVWLLFVVITLCYNTEAGKSLMRMIIEDNSLRFLYDINPIMKMMTTLR